MKTAPRKRRVTSAKPRSRARTKKISPPVEPGSRAEQYAAGQALRTKCPRKVHAVWKERSKSRDVVELVLAAEKGRQPDLLPLRHGRMVRSAFTFYRGAALPMAADLASTPSTGVHVQCCGDAHLSNFGGFATPERRVIFSINDLDETHPAPWEWDVKRLVASFVVASRDNGLSDAAARDAAMTCVRSYRESMAEFSEMKTLELWYYAMEAEELVGSIKDPDFRRRAIKRLQKERGHSIAEDTFPKLAEIRGNVHVIKDQLPTIFHVEGHPPGKVQASLKELFAAYQATLPDSYQSLLDRYALKDAAMKVVGIGSVGTFCAVLLLMAGEGDPLFLQVKEARASVLEAYTGASKFANHGRRVVNGYRLMQTASDMFLGWTQGGRDGRHFFIRQLRDIKISIRVETFGTMEMDLYATWCGRALALSHARSGSSVLLSGYMGKSDTFDQALADFSMAYADQNEKDHGALERAVKQGKVKAVFEADK
jgi:uncharacterized protein (DUF2252 family)